MSSAAQTLLTRYADEVAFVAEEAPAATLTEFVAQLGTVSTRLNDAGIDGVDSLDAAATYLADGDLSARVRKLLVNLPDMVDEYRDMV
ncbi:hypothetical protein [Streptomyces sp. ECR3.8]|uniref:hypothetical protein n=1 Tax=Streptomyces sp. ECR3.8 TaxID=3461009 RepID=UPI0040431517